MKKIIHIIYYITALSLLLITFYANKVLILSDFEILFYRNAFFFFNGIFLLLYLNLKINLLISNSNNLLVTRHTRMNIFTLEYKVLLTQPPLVFSLFSYSVFNIIVLLNNKESMDYIVFDLIVIIIQYFYFNWFLLFTKNFFPKDSKNFVMIIVVLISSINILGNNMNENIYVLLNPFVGWIYIFNLIEVDSLPLKATILICACIAVFAMIKFLTGKFINWHVSVHDSD